MRCLRAIGMTLLLVARLLEVGWAAEVHSPNQPFAVPIASDGVQRATVILDSYSYVPDHLIVAAGKPVELTLKSVTLVTPHNFIIQGPGGNFLVKEEVSAGESVVIKFTSWQTGVFPIYCDKRLWPMPSHQEKGMEGKLEVR